MQGYAIAHIDEIPELTPGGDDVAMRPVRHHFGIGSFGANAFVAKTAGDRIINEHVEDSPPNEELYFVVSGRATFELDGERRDAPAGTFVSVAPQVRRTAFAEEAGTTVLVVGSTPGAAYEAVGSELWYPLQQAYQAGDYDAVIGPLREAVEAHPEYPLLVYNLACLESLTGDTESAIAHLRRAVDASERFREFAKGDSDLDPIRDDPAYAQIVG